ncbi:hypothetical protein CAPTEDRAFT_193132 [Capitella teleta]|uniref:Major facilitator superfamily (MFS) profile domain-containing protein n=1 Tax=Capitella teleta TaxID=283909 RepID=R7UUZ7_CAPTE|nr:hypothetical protein CAPTEDRAFT_193132 [Capitella teleta]|eukprot:ELU07762.1 hypothetical protein CAPTEDRAFT_193132 [Capitella teleta]
MTSLVVNAHDIDVISDASDSDSDVELFNRPSDQTLLLQDSRLDKACDGRLRPENMCSEIEQQLQLSQPRQLISEAQLQQKRSVTRRFLIVCVTMLLLTTALPLSTPSLALVNIEDDSLKVIALGCLYGCLLVSSLFTPLILRCTGEKMASLAGGVGVALCVSSRFRPSPPFVIPGFAAAGLFLGPCLTVLCSRVITITNEHVFLVGSVSGKTLLFFSGIFQTWALAAGWLAQLLTMVSLDFPWSNDPYTANDTASSCGAQYCWDNFVMSPSFSVVSDNTESVMGHRMQALLGCLMACSVVAVLLALFGIDRPKGEDDGQSCHVVFGEVFLLLKKPEVRLLSPVLILSGARQHLCYQYLIQAFSTCSLQSRSGSFALLGALITSSFMAPSLGFFFGVAGRLRVALPLFLLEAILLLLTLTWPVVAWPAAAFFVITCLLAVIDSAWQVLCPALLAQLLPNHLNASMAALRACQAVGYLAVYAVQASSVCSQHLLIGMQLLLALSMICHVVMEIQVRLREQDMKSNPDEHKIVLPPLNEATWLPHINPMRVRKERTSALTNFTAEGKKVRT